MSFDEVLDSGRRREWDCPVFCREDARRYGVVFGAALDNAARLDERPEDSVPLAVREPDRECSLPRFHCSEQYGCAKGALNTRSGVIGGRWRSR